jgi:hypothetical protein
LFLLLSSAFKKQLIRSKTILRCGGEPVGRGAPLGGRLALPRCSRHARVVGDTSSWKGTRRRWRRRWETWSRSRSSARRFVEATPAVLGCARWSICSPQWRRSASTTVASRLAEALRCVAFCSIATGNCQFFYLRWLGFVIVLSMHDSHRNENRCIVISFYVNWLNHDRFLCLMDQRKSG